MDSTQLNIDAEEVETNYKKMWLFAGAAAIMTGVAILTRKKSITFDETDPPPIIIKSGSFIIESKNDLVPPTHHQPQYRTQNFGRIKRIMVVGYNEGDKGDIFIDDFDEINDWSPADTIQINVNLFSQSWGNLRQVSFRDESSGNLIIDTQIDLSARKRKNHKYRDTRREDDEGVIFSFQNVEIINLTRNRTIKSYSPKNNREYIIGVYNKLT